MSYIPDCRSDEYYNQKYLVGDDKEFIRGFDWCVEMEVDSFFDNFDVVGSDYLELALARQVPEELQFEYETEDAFSLFREESLPEHRKVETYLDYLWYKLRMWIEIQRNELITVLLDEMDEEEYQKVKAAVDAKESQSVAGKDTIDLTEIMTEAQQSIAGQPTTND